MICLSCVMAEMCFILVIYSPKDNILKKIAPILTRIFRFNMLNLGIFLWIIYNTGIWDVLSVPYIFTYLGIIYPLHFGKCLIIYKRFMMRLSCLIAEMCFILVTYSSKESILKKIPPILKRIFRFNMLNYDMLLWRIHNKRM